jgi:rubrerythrin
MSAEPHENVDLFLAYAVKLEQEAALRYGQLADSMGAAGNRDAEKIFRKLAKFSQMHYAEARARSGFHDLPSLRPSEFQWPSFESPETAAIWAADPLIAKEQALEIALDAERAAHDFYAQMLERSSDPEVKAAAREFVAEEAEHVQWMLRWIEEDKANVAHDWVDSLEFHV